MTTTSHNAAATTVTPSIANTLPIVGIAIRAMPVLIAAPTPPNAPPINPPTTTRPIGRKLRTNRYLGIGGSSALSTPSTTALSPDHSPFSLSSLIEPSGIAIG